MKFLVESKCDILLKCNNEGILEVASRWNHAPAIAFLLDHISDPQLISAAMRVAASQAILDLFTSKGYRLADSCCSLV